MQSCKVISVQSGCSPPTFPDIFFPSGLKHEWKIQVVVLRYYSTVVWNVIFFLLVSSIKWKFCVVDTTWKLKNTVFPRDNLYICSHMTCMNNIKQGETQCVCAWLSGFHLINTGLSVSICCAALLLLSPLIFQCKAIINRKHTDHWRRNSSAVHIYI